MLDRTAAFVADPIHASIGSLVGGLAMQAVVPEVTGWVDIALRVAPIVGPGIVLLATRIAAGYSARHRALAAAKRRRAEAQRLDGNPANDADIPRLLDEADALEADAAAADALAGTRHTDAAE